MMSPNPDQLTPAGPDAAGTTVLERVELPQAVEPGDHERFSHYVRKNRVMQSTIEGTPLVALCGKVWVPSRDPQRFPVCPACKEIYEQMKPGDESGGGQ